RHWAPPCRGRARPTGAPIWARVPNGRPRAARHSLMEAIDHARHTYDIRGRAAAHDPRTVAIGHRPRAAVRTAHHQLAGRQAPRAARLPGPGAGAGRPGVAWRDLRQW